ncbi:MAG: restriction endonuclease subunit S, partial [Candidatus Poribacteria bacterium]|nr:restriction endonuclease subunit S [Candidatus Poribacteria bacterium]
EKYLDWEEKKISEIFKITRGNVLAVNEMTTCLEADHVYPVFSSQTKDNGLLGYYTDYLYESAITWTTDGANAGEVKYRDGKFYCTNVCGVLLSKEGFANQCISEILNKVTRKYVSYVGNPKLMNNVMATIKICLPQLKEQQKIAAFLSSIDKKIELVAEQLKQAQTFKKGLLQQMFI